MIIGQFILVCVFAHGCFKLGQTFGGFISDKMDEQVDKLPPRKGKKIG